MAKKQGMITRTINRLNEEKAAKEHAAVQQTQSNLSNNLKTDLQSSNAPDVQTGAVGAEDAPLVGGTSNKRRRATGALSSTLGVNV